MLAAVTGGLLLIALAASCGGSGTSYSGPTPGTPSATPEPSSLTDLDRYHYVATLELHGSKPDGSANDVTLTTEGDYQSPDRHAFTYTATLAGAALQQSAVVVGDRIWLKNGNDPWRAATPDDPQASNLFAVAFSPIKPGFLGGPEFRQARETVRRLPSTLEFVNDLRAYHYQVGQEGVDYFQSLLAQQQLFAQAQDLHWDVWLAQDGAWPVRLLATGAIRVEVPVFEQLDLRAPTSWTLRIDVSRPNDPTLTVEVPS
jgi:hypothetical protein